MIYHFENSGNGTVDSQMQTNLLQVKTIFWNQLIITGLTSITSEMMNVLIDGRREILNGLK